MHTTAFLPRNRLGLVDFYFSNKRLQESSLLQAFFPVSIACTPWEVTRKLGRIGDTRLVMAPAGSIAEKGRLCDSFGCAQREVTRS